MRVVVSISEEEWLLEFLSSVHRRFSCARSRGTSKNVVAGDRQVVSTLKRVEVSYNLCS
jgi:hypothetical protein